MNVRKAILAGSWYPAGSSACEQEIGRFLNEYDTGTLSSKNLVGGIVPHAGWYFSGSVACNVIQCLRQESLPDVFIVFGMHLHSGSSNYIMTHGAWETPFGPVQIETELAEALANRFHFNIETPDDFSQDNTIEVQLPFIKYFFENAKIVPIGSPPVTASFEVGKTAVDVARQMGLQLKVLGSTDLTHYGPNYGFTPQGTGAEAFAWVRDENDHNVIDAMLSMDPQKVLSEARNHHNACCSGAAATAIATANYLGADTAETMTYANSYDKNPGDSFVGYVGIVF